MSEKEKDMNDSNILTHDELLRDEPPMPPDVLASLRKVLDYRMEAERRDYEVTAPDTREGHIFRDLHRLDCWLTEHEPSDGWDYPTELKDLGQVMVTPEVMREFSYEELQRALDEHRMRRWGTGPDVAAGEGNRWTRRGIQEQNGELTSYSDIRESRLWVVTRLMPSTTVRVITAESVRASGEEWEPKL
jgi:hypothetical protein